MPHVKSQELCGFTKVPDGPQAYTLNILWLQKKGTQMHMSERGQGLTFTKKCEPRFPLLLHIPYTVDCPAALVGEDVSSVSYVQ